MTTTKTNDAAAELHAAADDMDADEGGYISPEAIARHKAIMDRICRALDMLNAEIDAGTVTIRNQRQGREHFQRMLKQIDEQREREVAAALLIHSTNAAPNSEE